MPIAAGCIVNDRGEVLICQRPAHKSYAGQWEFPGGKIERGESAEAALRRELQEELQIDVVTSRPLIRVRHTYPELTVELETWLVTGFTGEVRSTEHPALAWVAPGRLADWPLLAADRPIVHALRLPAHYAFTPPAASLTALAEALPALPAGALVRLRQPALPDAEYRRVAAALLPGCRAGGHALLLDRDPAMVGELGADGWHATAQALLALAPGFRCGASGLPTQAWFAASIHDEAELAAARRAGADFTVAGPVAATASHPGTTPLGWPRFAALCAGANLPVFAIGGVGPADLAQAFRHGAQGCAGISAYWRSLPSDSSGASTGIA